MSNDLSKYQVIDLPDLKAFRFGRIHVAIRRNEHAEIEGIGFSVRSEIDKPNDELGLKIATGRAQKSLSIKIHNTTIRELIKQTSDTDERKRLSKKLKHAHSHFMS